MKILRWFYTSFLIVLCFTVVNSYFKYQNFKSERLSPDKVYDSNIFLANLTETERFAEIKCMADNIYYEASNQPLIGKVAVAYVTLNRVEDSDFKDSICGVVYEKSPNKNRTCQFSWTCQAKRFKPITDANVAVWKSCYDIAISVILNYNKHVDPTEGALFYHADWINPKWKREKIAQIENHIFYK